MKMDDLKCECTMEDMMITIFVAIIGTILAISLWALYDFDFDAMMYEEDEQ